MYTMALHLTATPTLSGFLRRHEELALDFNKAFDTARTAEEPHWPPSRKARRPEEGPFH